MDASQLVVYLNSIDVGQLDKIESKLELAQQACISIDQEEMARKLREAGEALHRADMKTYRKRLETVIARLGHIR